MSGHGTAPVRGNGWVHPPVPGHGGSRGHACVREIAVATGEDTRNLTGNTLHVRLYAPMIGLNPCFRFHWHNPRPDGGDDLYCCMIAPTGAYQAARSFLSTSIWVSCRFAISIMPTTIRPTGLLKLPKLAFSSRAFTASSSCCVIAGNPCGEGFLRDWLWRLRILFHFRLVLATQFGRFALPPDFHQFRRPRCHNPTISIWK